MSETIKAILIDIDNTLLDFDKCAKCAMQSGYEDFGLHFDDAMYDDFQRINLAMWEDMERGNITKEELINTRWQNVFAYLGIEANGVEFEALFRKYLNEKTIEVDGAMEALQYLSSKYDLYAASNAPYNQQIHRLTSANMLQYIKKVFVSEEIGFPKPKKEFFDACFQNIPYKKEETIMLGDSLTADIQGANNYGIRSCWYNHFGNNDTNVDCTWQINSMRDVKKVL